MRGTYTLYFCRHLIIHNLGLIPKNSGDVEMATSKKGSIVLSEEDIALGAISMPETEYPEDASDYKWALLYTTLGPITDWLTTGIIPHIRVDFFNKISPGILPQYPRVDVKLEPNMYKLGIGRNTFAGSTFPPYHEMVRRRSELATKHGEVGASFITKEKSGYSSTLTQGTTNFMYRFESDQHTGRTSDLFVSPTIFSLVNSRQSIPKSKKTLDNMIKVMGEDYFEIQTAYHKTFKLEKTFSEYLLQATGVPPLDLITMLISELGIDDWILDGVQDDEVEYRDDEARVHNLVENYLKWLDSNVRTFDISSPPVTASSMQLMASANGETKGVEVVSLSDPAMRSASLPRDVAYQLGSRDSHYGASLDYNFGVREFFVTCVMSARQGVFNLKVNLPKTVAEYMTQSKPVDEYYLAQLINKYQTEMEDFNTYENPKYAVNIGGHSTGFYANPPVEVAIEALERRVNSGAKGVNSKGLGVDDSGKIVYIPTKLNNLKSHRAQVEEYFAGLTPSSGKKVLAIRDPWDIVGNQRVFGKTIDDKVRPERPGTIKPLYVDWGIGVVIGVDGDGNINTLKNVEHVTPLTDNLFKNYANAATYPIIPNNNFSTNHSINISKVTAKTKPNQWDAITKPMEFIIKLLMPKVVSGSELATVLSDHATNLFGTPVNGEVLIDEGTLGMLVSQVNRVPNTMDGIGSLMAITSRMYAMASSRLHSIYGSEENIPPEFDDIMDIGMQGEGQYLTLNKLQESSSSPSLFVRMYSHIIKTMWKAVEGNFKMLTNVTSFDMSTHYYGTLFAIADLIENPRNVSAVAYNTDSFPADHEPSPLPGSREGYTMIPHQVRVDYHMERMSDHGIEYTILAAMAGAGKTHNLLNDVMRKLEKGLIKRPLIICPSYLEKNYIEDSAYIYEGRFNVVPLDTVIKNYSPLYQVRDPLGLEGILNMIQNAPPNTIFITSFTFLSSGKADHIPVGTEYVTINPNLEVMLSAGFDYVGADESQELRNEGTAKSDASKALFYRAKYRSLATGTFLNTSPSDIPAQTSMLDPTIFGAHSSFKDYYSEDDGRKGAKIAKLREGRKNELVEALKSGTGYIQVRRKEWASLLPQRRDSYHRMQLDEESTQWKLYQAVLKFVLTEIEKMLEKNKKLRNSDEEDEEAQQGLESLLNPYLARLEMLLITPSLDDDYEKLLNMLDLEYDENYVSPAVERCIHIIKSHIQGVDLKNLPEGTTRDDMLQDVSDFMGLDDLDIADDLEFISPIPGKILVFCNYHTSVDALYNALPPDLKKQAIRYDTTQKDAHIFEFKNNPEKKILIGIQNSLSTGHNFQFCTRLIRLEQVWSPGEVEQGESRINRPDPKNKGKQRSRIFYDWIVVDGTIQVTKMSRLISRMIVNNQIEEHGNALYDDVEYLPLLVMNLGTIANNCWFVAPNEEAGGESTRSLMTYLKTKNQIDSIQQADYLDWAERYKGPTKPIEVKSGNILEGSAVIVNIPPIPGQVVANASQFDVVNVAQYETMQGSQHVNLEGMRCLTPEGDGIIIINPKTKDTSGATLFVEINGAKYTFERLAVNLYLNEDYSREDLLKATGLNKFQTISGAVTNFSGISKSEEVVKKAKKAVKEEVLEDEQELEAIVQDMAKEVKRKRDATKQDLEDLYSKSVKVLQTKKSSKSPLPQPTDFGEPDQVVDINAYNLNGMLGLCMTSEDADLQTAKASRLLSRLGYHKEPDVWYTHIPNRVALKKLLDAWESKFNIPETTMEILNEMYDSFNAGRKRMFNAEHATSHEIKDYWIRDAKISRSKDTKLLNPQPFVQDGELYIMLHMELPASKLAKRVKVPNIEWDSAGGLWIKMYSTKKQCGVDLVELQKFYKIADKETLKNEIRDVKITNKRPEVKK